MSGIAKPGIYCAGAISPYDTILIPGELIQNVSKLDLSAAPNGTTAAYYLVFPPANPLAAGTRTMYIPFATSGARNTSYTNVKTTLGTSVA